MSMRELNWFLSLVEEEEAEMPQRPSPSRWHELEHDEGLRRSLNSLHRKLDIQMASLDALNAAVAQLQTSETAAATELQALADAVSGLTAGQISQAQIDTLTDSVTNVATALGTATTAAANQAPTGTAVIGGEPTQVPTDPTPTPPVEPPVDPTQPAPLPVGGDVPINPPPLDPTSPPVGGDVPVDTPPVDPNAPADPASPPVGSDVPPIPPASPTDPNAPIFPPPPLGS